MISLKTTTYQHDLKIRDLFVGLLEDTQYKEFAFEQKTLYMLSSAFHIGDNVFNFQSFQKEFGKYISFIK